MSLELIARKIVGFDMRRRSSLPFVYMTSFDEKVRYEEINDSFNSFQSGMNLYSRNPREIRAFTMPVDAMVVAFDLPGDIVDRLLRGNVSNPGPLPQVNIAMGWQFLGFDIVDPVTQTSALYGFDLASEFIDDLLREHDVERNKHGLIDLASKSLSLAKYFDQTFPEHAPFSPCGIWLQDDGDDGGGSDKRTRADA